MAGYTYRCPTLPTVLDVQDVAFSGLILLDQVQAIKASDRIASDRLRDLRDRLHAMITTSQPMDPRGQASAISELRTLICDTVQAAVAEVSNYTSNPEVTRALDDFIASTDQYAAMIANRGAGARGRAVALTVVAVAAIGGAVWWMTRRSGRQQAFAHGTEAAQFGRGAPRRPPYEARSGERFDRVCYPTKAAAARAFASTNRDVIAEWGGLDQPGSRGEFDSVNEKLELRGRRRVTTIAQAILAAIPPHRPYCLSNVDLDMLNETRPGRDYGPFRLPEIVAERRAWEDMGYDRDDSDPPF